MTGSGFCRSLSCCRWITWPTLCPTERGTPDGRTPGSLGAEDRDPARGTATPLRGGLVVAVQASVAQLATRWRRHRLSAPVSRQVVRHSCVPASPVVQRFFTRPGKQSVTRASDANTHSGNRSLSARKLAYPAHPINQPVRLFRIRRDGQSPHRRRTGGELPHIRHGRADSSGAAALLAIFTTVFIARIYVIPSSSMETTLHGCDGCQNDRVLVDKLVYKFRKPAPGEIIVFTAPSSWTDVQPNHRQAVLIKRVIAVGGQTVACCRPQNRVTVDDVAIDEPYISFSADSFGLNYAARFSSQKASCGSWETTATTHSTRECLATVPSLSVTSSARQD